jgi:hypothetical protein
LRRSRGRALQAQGERHAQGLARRGIGTAADPGQDQQVQQQGQPAQRQQAPVPGQVDGECLHGASLTVAPELSTAPQPGRAARRVLILRKSAPGRMT